MSPRRGGLRDPVYSRSVELMEAALGDELVALDAKAGRCFGFNEVATDVWRSLAEPKTFEQLKDELLASYDVDPGRCMVELQDLLNDLTEKGLVTSE